MRYVTYCRVSTDKQGVHGLGMDAQRDAVELHARRTGGEIVAAYIEVESGKKNDREQLRCAIQHCRAASAVLLIAKLDRLARNVAFVSALMDSGIEFVAADMPTANRLTIHILAAVAEHEAAMISARTKAALAQAKARGTKLGGYRGVIVNADAGRQRSVSCRQQASKDRASHILPIINHIKAAGVTTLRGIAAELGNRGVAAPRGGVWTATQVMRLTA
jgi:DNA invertase Pin-like site-specific DNA recombinase